MADLSIAIEILGIDKASGPFGAVAKGAGGLLGGLRDLGLGALGIGTAFDTVKGAVEGLLGPAIDAQQVATQTAAVLKSTGGAAGLTADDVAGLAGSLSKLTPFEDEAIQSAENLLLTFTNIGGDIMPQATETVLNMSQALGQDLKSSSVQLGKALNDPIKGITALSRVGVSFTQEQKDQIKVMQEAGDTAGAQAIILGELDKEFGGAAKAAGQTFGGQLVILQTAIGNVAEAIGGPLIGGLSTLATAALPAVQAFADELPGAIEGFIADLSGLQAAIAPQVQGLTDAWNTVIQVFQGDWSASDSIDPVIKLLGQFATIVRDDVIPILQYVGDIVVSVFAGDFRSAMLDVQDIMGTVVPFLVQDLAAMGQAFLNWIGPIIPPLLQQLLDVALQIDTWIVQTGLPMLVTQLAVWAGAFVDWVAPLIPPLLVELGTLAVQIGSWMLTVALPAMAANLLQWGVAFVEWVAPRIPLLIGELAKLELALITWTITDALPAIVKQMVAWGAAFVDWVGTEVLPKLPGALAGILDAISNWAAGALNEAAAALEPLGQSLVDGIGDGIANNWANLQTFFGNQLRTLFPFAAAVIEAHSPSRLAARLIGQPIAQGIALGIQQGGSGINDVMQIVINEAIKNGIDPLIALALAKAESGLNPNAIGDNGHSVGLFQLHDQGQGAGQSVAQRQDPQHNAGQFLAAHAALYKQLVAEGLAGDQLAATFGRLAEQSDPQFAQRYAQAYRELAAQLGTTNLAARTSAAGTALLATTQQQGVTWAQTMAEQQQALTNTLSQQAPPMRATTDAMAAFGAVLGPIERHVADGGFSLKTLEFNMVDLARATGLATKPWADYDAGLIDIDQAMERVINQAADAGPQFEALRQQQDDVGRSTRQNALDFLQLALNYQKVTPAADANAQATGDAAQQTGQATDAVGSLTSKYDLLGPKITDATKLVGDFQKSLDTLDPHRIDDVAGSWDHLSDRIGNATDRLKDYINQLQNAPRGDGLPGFAGGGTFARGGFAITGELGPEVASWPAGTHFTPNSQLHSLGGGSGGGDTYVFNFPNYVGSRSELVTMLKSELVLDKRRNGRLPWES